MEGFFTKNPPKFADHKTIASCLNAPVYFAHPHSPWERGTNENTNRLLRQYFPKKTKAVYTAAYLADCRQKINTRPRKCLGFASPASRFFFELNKLHFKVESAQGKELGEFELDESYFGARRVRGKRGRGAAGKTPVFGLVKRNGKVFVTVVPNCSKEELMPII